MGLEIEAIASELRVAGETQNPLAPIRSRLPENDIDAAYAIQDANTQYAQVQGRRLVGRKIGLTSLAVQKQLTVDQPDFGMLFADMEMPEGLPIATTGLIQPKIEAEIAFIMQSGLPMEQPTVADVIAATAYVLPAFEIVDSRIRDWQIQIVDTVADNASSGLYVLGGPARRLADLDLRAMKMEMRSGGALVSQGQGSDCLGHPLNAVRWLAQELVKRGRPLLADDIVLSGALGPMVSVQPGATYEAKIAGLGTVTAMFAEAK